MKRKLQAGFSAVEALLIVLVLAAVGAVGYFAVNRSENSRTPDGTANTTNDGASETAPEIKQTADLANAEKTVDSTELDSADSELDTELDKF